MKHVFLAAAMAAALVVTTPTAQAQVSFGAHGAYDLDAESFGVGLQARAGANLGGFSLVLNPNVDYYFLEDSDNVDASLIAAGVDLLYQIGDEYVTAFQPYFGAGLAIRRYSAEVDVNIPGIDNDVSETDLGLNIIGGAQFAVGAPVTPFVQATLTVMDGTPVGLKAGILFGGGR